MRVGVGVDEEKEVNEVAQLTRGQLWRKAVWLAALAGAVDLVLYTLLRMAFWHWFQTPSDPVPMGALMRAFYIGLKFDLRLVLIMHLPLVMFAWMERASIVRAKRFWLIYLTFINLFVLLGYIFDFGHYAYVQSRLNATAIRFLENPIISATMIWETYPVLPIVAGLGLVAWGWWVGLRWLMQRVELMHAGTLPKWRAVAVHGLIIALVLGGLYGKASHYPLRWSDAYFDPNPFVSSVALNPLLFLADTLKNRQEPYNEDQTKKHYDMMAQYLGVEDNRLLNYKRAHSPKGLFTKKPNVIIVLLESYAFHKTGLSGNPLDPTPNFDAMARGGVLFTRHYVPSSGTARSVFALLTGIPDVETQETSSRNPLIVDQHTIVNAFAGYEKLYFLGGSANWANIRGLLSHNIPGLRIYEEGSYSSPRTDVWGISDLHLFEESLKVLRQERGPFFAVIHTSGNHRPYTIPQDNRDFKPIAIADDKVKPYGFVGADEYNSFRFMDHSIGVFLEAVKREPFFADTLLVFLGDHGLPGEAAHMPKSQEQLMLTRYNVPLVLYAPAVLSARTINEVASELDVMPTVASVTGMPYINTTLGRDLLAKDGHGRYAFTVSEQSMVMEVGVIGLEHYFTMNADGTSKRLYALGSASPREDMSARQPKVADDYWRLTEALFETANYMRFHNKP